MAMPLFLELFLHGRSRITDLVDGALQLLLRNSKMFDPVTDLKSLIHRNLRSVRLAPLWEIVRHRILLFHAFDGFFKSDFFLVRVTKDQARRCVSKAGLVFGQH
jgi:hypothetical protein